MPEPVPLLPVPVPVPLPPVLVQAVTQAAGGAVVIAVLHEADALERQASVQLVFEQSQADTQEPYEPQADSTLDAYELQAEFDS